MRTMRQIRNARNQENRTYFLKWDEEKQMRYYSPSTEGRQMTISERASAVFVIICTVVAVVYALA